MSRRPTDAWRLFVAADLDGPAHGNLVAALARLPSPDPASPGPVRWIDPVRWHLTLVFLGDVPRTRLDRLTANLADAAAASPPVQWRLAGAGTFPERRAPRVLWAGVAGEVDRLAVIARRVRHAARASGVDVERRAYRPHLTLARVRDGAGPGADPEPRTHTDLLVRGLADYRGPVVRSSEILLYRSHPGPSPVYEPLARFALGGPEPARRAARTHGPADASDQSRSTT